jgi:7-carboxy-7-deazaguanine synthase
MTHPQPLPPGGPVAIPPPLPAQIGGPVGAGPITLPVAEVYGPVWQGEGPHAGRRCSFLRLGHCNLDCAWCDQPETWDAARHDLAQTCPETSVTAVLGALLGHRTTLCVMTGGEPLLWQSREGLSALVTGWQGRWHVETYGTLVPRPWLAERVDHWTVSPKLDNSGVAERRRVKPKPLAAFRELASCGRACFKFVCASILDVREAAEMAAAHDLPADAVWIMPEGTTAAAVVETHRAIAAAVHAHGFHTTTRLHTLLYDDQKGR